MNVHQQEADGRRGEEADQALRLTNEKLQGLIQASSLAIYALDREGKIRSWNAAAERIFGWSEAEALGRPVPSVPPEKEPEARQLQERVLRGETFTSIEARRQRKDGTLIDVSFSAAPLFDADGQVSGMMAVV